jgi:hypothetical protein
MVEESMPLVEAAKAEQAERLEELEAVEHGLQLAEDEIAAAASTTGSAAKANVAARQKVTGAESSVETCRLAVRKLGGSGGGSGESELPDSVSEMPGADDGTEGISLSVVEKLQPRELDEVRKLSRPPAVVRRALDVVQALLKIAEAEDTPDNLSKKEADWADLQAMIAAPGFVKRVVAMKPLALSLHPNLLQQASDRWPGLLVRAPPQRHDVAIAPHLARGHRLLPLAPPSSHVRLPSARVRCAGARAEGGHRAGQAEEFEGRHQGRAEHAESEARGGRRRQRRRLVEWRQPARQGGRGRRSARRRAGRGAEGGLAAGGRDQDGADGGEVRWADD